jgi:hypothetical protein
MADRIIYNTEEGDMVILTPSVECGLTTMEIALKDVPTGFPFKIVDETYLPADRTYRDAWEIDNALLTDGVGA